MNLGVSARSSGDGEIVGDLWPDGGTPAVAVRVMKTYNPGLVKAGRREHPYSRDPALLRRNDFYAPVLLMDYVARLERSLHKIAALPEHIERHPGSRQFEGVRADCRDLQVAHPRQIRRVRKGVECGQGGAPPCIRG